VFRRLFIDELKTSLWGFSSGLDR